MAPTPVRDGRRAAIVTGGATGVGAATAIMLAQRGYDLAIMFSKSRKEAEETAAACEHAGARAIAIKGKPVYVEAFGVADRETGEAVTPQHRFRIASISKTVTATGIFTLIEQKKLRLDSYENLMRGAGCGHVIRPGHPHVARQLSPRLARSQTSHRYALRALPCDLSR